MTVLLTCVAFNGKMNNTITDQLHQSRVMVVGFTKIGT